MNKIIVLGNLKGGVGKSTVSMLLALYLHEKGYRVRVVDGDVQHTIAKTRDDELKIHPEYADLESYQIVTVEPTNIDATVNVINDAGDFDGVVIYDTPGNLDADSLIFTYRAANTVIVPYRYDANSLQSTIGYVLYLNTLKKDFEDFGAPLFFVPNNMEWNWGTAADRAGWENINSQFLEKHGTILQRIPRRKCFQNLSTFRLTDEQRKVLEGNFDLIRMNVIDN